MSHSSDLCCSGQIDSGAPCKCTLTRAQLTDKGFGFGLPCPESSCAHPYFCHPKGDRSVIDSDDDLESEHEESTIYDQEYFDSKSPSRHKIVVVHVCVFSVVVHGPYGLDRKGVRDYFRNRLRKNSPEHTSIKWSTAGTKLRVILINFQPTEKETVINALKELQKETDFEFYEKIDTEFHVQKDDNIVFDKFDTGMTGLQKEEEIPPTYAIRRRTMSNEDDLCYNDGCDALHKRKRVCKRCKVAKYCSRKCEKQHAAAHKSKCKPASSPKK
mmetsp:Transcript_8438/g.12575  ORF Transcript_8438/g.12575 Transcript_8438/m.12575 type:complete len:271 (-) Transcript_8438:154-966(-)